MSYRTRRRSSSMATSSSFSGTGFSGLLTIVFIALKLTGNISWPWIWVLSPLWISLILGIAIFAIVFLLAYLNSK